jgi:lipopolysaccharide biosynthesis glycosyltransferase
MEHKKWHKKWRHLSDRAAQCFNAGFVIFKNEFFRSEMYESIKHAIKKQQPLNDEKFLRIFLSRDNQKVLHAPTKYNARIIWLHSGQGKRRYGAYVGDEGDEAVHVVHYVGQENKPWLRHPGRSNLTYWYDRWDECNDWEIE